MQNECRVLTAKKEVSNRFSVHSNNKDNRSNTTSGNDNKEADTTSASASSTGSLRYTTDVIQQLLDRNAEILQSWIRVKERGGVSMTGVPDELQNNLSGLAAAAMHDGADDFFPLRPGNVEVGGKNIVEPEKKFHASKKVGVDPHARRAGVSALEISILTELHNSTFATSKQLSDAISVSLQRLLRLKDGNLSKIQRHVRDILLRIISADLNVPHAFQAADAIISTLLFDLKKGQLSLDKYRKRLSSLSSSQHQHANDGQFYNSNDSDAQQRVGNVNLLPLGRSIIGPNNVGISSHNISSNNSVNQFIRQQQQLHAQMQHAQHQLQLHAQMQNGNVRRPVGRPRKNIQEQQRMLLLAVAKQQQQQQLNLQAIRQAQNQKAVESDMSPPKQNSNVARKKLPFIMNMGGGNQDLQVKVWLPDNLIDELRKRG
eukprot:g4182.t1